MTKIPSFVINNIHYAHINYEEGFLQYGEFHEQELFEDLDEHATGTTLTTGLSHKLHCYRNLCSDLLLKDGTTLVQFRKARRKILYSGDDW